MAPNHCESFVRWANFQMAVMQRTPVWGDWGSSDDEPARAIVFCKGHASIRAVSLHVFTKGMSADMRTYDASEDIIQNRLTDRPEGDYLCELRINRVSLQSSVPPGPPYMMWFASSALLLQCHCPIGSQGFC